MPLEVVAGAELGSGPWWQPREVLLRFVTDMIADTLFRQRRSSDLRPRPWPQDLDLSQDLGVDSLERMELATSLAECLHLHESGVEDYLLAKPSLGDWVDIAQAGLAHFSAQLTFRTSGSSGLSKACMHSMATLLQETGQLAALFSGRRRLLFAVPSHHIYGFLFTVLLPRALGLPPGAVLDLRGSTPAWLARGAQAGDLVIGHPDFWRAVGRAAPRLPPGVIGVTSTAPCPESVSEAVEAAGLAGLYHLYGSSETAGIGWRASHREPYALFPYWTFPPDQCDELVRQLPDGTVQTFPCQDRLERLDAGLFQVGARRDNAVQVGGINVFPSSVEAVLRRHPLVDEAAVRLMRPEEGTRLKAYVVPGPDVSDRTLFLAQLRTWIAAQLTVAERPKAIRVGNRLPMTASGKLADWDVGTEPENPGGS